MAIIISRLLARTARRHFISTICLLLNFSVCEDLKAFPLLGVDPIPAPLMMEDHSQALASWAEQGIRDAVVINFDSHGDIRPIPESKIATLQDMYRRRDWKGFKEADSVADHGLYNIGNWLYAGARLGIFREIYWVIPHNMFPGNDYEEHLRQFLRSRMFSVKDIQTFRMDNKQFRGLFNGIPITVCSPESLPDINSPLLLSIDTDFFPVYSNAYRTHYLTALNKIFRAIFRKNYRIQGAVVSYSVNGEYLNPHLRWVADTVGMILNDPKILDEPPSAMLKLLLKLDNAYRSTDPVTILKHVKHYDPLYPEAPILLYKAYAHMLNGDTDKAYETAAASCKIDKRYCAGLPYIGSLYSVKNDCVTAERFFRAGIAADPEMSNGVHRLAQCLRDNGNFSEAVVYYKKTVLLNGSFPMGFMLFETYLMSGNRQEALNSLKAAVRSLEQYPYAEVINQPTADAIYTAIDYTDKEDLKDMLKTLRDHMAVKHMLINYPRSHLIPALQGL